MELNKEQIRLLLHFQHGLGLNASEAARQICEVYWPGKVTDRTARNWFSKFRKDETNLEDKPRSGRPNEVDCHVVLSVIEDNPSMISRMLADDFDCDHALILKILHEAGKN